MADKYSTIQQHQPLRVPSGWDRQEKMLIVQLDEIFDDIYRRFGRLGVNDLGKKLKDLVLLKDEDGNYTSISAAIGEINIEVGNKYDKVSGITITTAGIDVSGSQYVKIASGGVFDVESTNFRISSQDKLMKSGDWTFGEHGIIKSYTVNSRTAQIGFGDLTLANNTPLRSMVLCDVEYLSAYSRYVPTIWFNLMDENNNQYHRFSITPRLSSQSDESIVLQNPSIWTTRNVIGAANDEWVIRGGIECLTTTETNMNNLVKPGVYEIDPAYMSQNKPSGWSDVGNVFVYSLNAYGEYTTNLLQEIVTVGAVFRRRYTGSAWTSWYKFTGTAV